MIFKECVFHFQIRTLRDLFDDDMIFVAFSSTEKPPEEGFDVEIQSKSILRSILNILLNFTNVLIYVNNMINVQTWLF